MGALRPPSAVVLWTATSLGSAWGGYKVYRRQHTTPIGPWVQIALLDGPSEARAIFFHDFEAGWAVANGRYVDGWDYAVTVVDNSVGIESALTATTTLTPAADSMPWMVSNQKPYLNFPLPMLSAVEGSDDNTLKSYRVAGRPAFVTRGRVERPGRTYKLTFALDDWPYAAVQASESFTGEDLLRMWRAAAMSGVPFAFHRPSGDRIIGTLGALDAHRLHDGLWVGATGTLIETETATAGVAGPNFGRNVAFNGSSQFASHPSNALLNPGSNPFTVVFCGYLAGTNGVVHLSKGNLGTADGYGFRNNALNQIQFFVDGATSSGGPAFAHPADVSYELHCWVGIHTGTAQTLDLDGVQVASTAVGTGAITNAVALAVGANNGGASGFAADAAQTYAVYNRALSADERKSLAYALLGFPGYRIPGGAALFVDIRDIRSMPAYTSGTNPVYDLSGNNLHGTITGAENAAPWDLEVVDAW